MGLPSNGPEVESEKVNIFNFSGVHISEGEKSLFSLGPKMVPNFSVSFEQKKIDVLKFSRKLLLKQQFHNSDYVSSDLIKPVSSYIPKSTNNETLKSCVEDLEMFANELPDVLNKSNTSDNLTSEQRVAIDTFKARNNVLLFKADKGSGICLLSPEFYKCKVLKILESSKYEMLPRNVDYFVNLKLRRFVNKFSFLSAPEKNAIVNFDYKSTNIYGLPKIHKSELVINAVKQNQGKYLFLKNPEDLDFRIIFGGPKNPCSGLASLTDTLLKPFICKVQSHIKDVFDFINKIPKFPPTDLPFIEIISVDIKQMYPNLEKEVGLPALRYFLTRYNELLPSRFSVDFVVEAMEFVLDNNTGYFNGQFFRQTTGTSTGIKPAPTYADLSIGFLEVMAFYKIRQGLGYKTASYFWMNYSRYLDDGFIFWDKRLGDFLEVFNILNNMHPSLKFTIERSDTSLKFLDVIVYKTMAGFKTVVNNKDTDSGTYLPFNSAHPRKCKINIPYNMARRIRALTDDDNLMIAKMQDLAARLRTGGYPEGTIRSAVQMAVGLSVSDLRKPKPRSEEENLMTFVHTYDPIFPELMSGVRSRISRLFISRECRPAFGGSRVIESRREPPNLLGMFQHSRFDEPSSASIVGGVAKCGLPNCKLCLEIMEVDQVTFINSGKTFKIRTKMDCTTRNVIYAVFCNKCNKSYIGETVNLRRRANDYRSNSKSLDNAVMKVYRHLYDCGNGFKMCPILKINDECKITRLVKEDRLIKTLKPDLNADKRNLLHLNLI